MADEQFTEADIESQHRPLQFANLAVVNKRIGHWSSASDHSRSETFREATCLCLCIALSTHPTPTHGAGVPGMYYEDRIRCHGG
jgi:hypothetical protein